MRHRHSFALALTVAFALTLRTDRLVAQTAAPLDRLLQWLDAVRHHQPGVFDPPAVDVAGWSKADLDGATRDARRLARFLDEATAKGNDNARITLRGRTFRVPEVRELVFGGNRMLERGAILHADIAMLAVDDVSARPAEGGVAAFQMEDGRSQGTRTQSAHWAVGRSLISAIAPEPADDPVALLWYRAVSAFLLRDGQMSVALPHLAAGRILFPSSWEILLDNAYLHQRFSSPEIQAAVDAMSLRGIRLDVLPPKDELEWAEKFFRQALAINPNLLEARVRMARVVSLLVRHGEAVAELRACLTANPKGALRYYTELFLAHEEQEVGNRERAREAFERASVLYPHAQSPHLALSQLARQSGDRAGAFHAMQQVMALPADETRRHDPWWSYFDMHAEDADALLRDLYDAVQN